MDQITYCQRRAAMTENPTISRPAATGTVNVPLLDAALDAIDANPERWDQRTWRCGTSMCLAGWVATIAGAEWASNRNDEVCVADPLNGGATMHVAAYARAQLGIDEEQGEALFAGYNTRVELQAMRDLLADHPTAARVQLADAAWDAYSATLRAEHTRDSGPAES